MKSEEYGFSNVPFSDGYNGFCINLAQKETTAGQEFEVKNTSAAVNNRNGEEIGNYLKILVVDYYNYTIENPRLAQDIIWKFSDNYNECNNTIVQGILELAQNGRIIPDHGEEKILNETTKVRFDFEVLDSVNWKTQNFFGYKLTYLDLVNDGMLGNSSEENNTFEDIFESEIPENNTNQTNNNTTTENNTNQTNNNTTTENNTNQTNNNTNQTNNNTNQTNNNTTTENNTNQTNNNTTTENNTNQALEDSSSLVSIPVDNSTHENATTLIEENPKDEVSIENKTGNPLVMLLILLGIIGFYPMKRD